MFSEFIESIYGISTYTQPVMEPVMSKKIIFVKASRAGFFSLLGRANACARRARYAIHPARCERRD